MKLLICLFTGFLLLNSPIQEVRDAFKIAHENAENATAFNKLMQKDLEIDQNTQKAYLGASEVILSDFKKGISKKIKSFKSGRNLIEDAIKTDQDNIELRLIRLIIQNQVPKILNYHSEIDSDKSFIIEHFSKAPPEVKSYVKDVSKTLEIFSKEELEQLK